MARPIVTTIALVLVIGAELYHVPRVRVTPIRWSAGASNTFGLITRD